MQVHKSQGLTLKWLHPYLPLPNTMCWVGGRDRLNSLFRHISFKMTKFHVKTICRTIVRVSLQFKSIICPQLYKMSVNHSSGQGTSSTMKFSYKQPVQKQYGFYQFFW